MEQLPIDDQQFVLEFIIKLNRNIEFSETNELNQKQRKTLKNVIETLDSVEPLGDDPLDEILTIDKSTTKIIKNPDYTGFFDIFKINRRFYT